LVALGFGREIFLGIYRGCVGKPILRCTRVIMTLYDDKGPFKLGHVDYG